MLWIALVWLSVATLVVLTIVVFKACWRRRLPAVAVEPLVERCEVCGRWLTRSELVEVTEVSADADIPEIAAWGGGTAMVATFCAEHVPLDVARPERDVA